MVRVRHLIKLLKKIKNRHISKEVVGLAVVGSYKGFDVITGV